MTAPDAQNALEHGYIVANGVRLHYAHVGQGPLILFLHGFPEFWYCWKHQLEEFGRDHLAVAPDLRGFNLSDRPADVKQYRARILIEEHKLYPDAIRTVLDGGWRIDGRRFLLSRIAEGSPSEE